MELERIRALKIRKIKQIRVFQRPKKTQSEKNFRLSNKSYNGKKS